MADLTMPESLSHLLEDVRSSLGVPFVSSFLGLAAEHPAFADAWAVLTPHVRSTAFMEAAARLRIAAAEDVRTSFFVGDHLAVLLRLGLYDDIPKVKACVVALEWTAAREALFLGLLAGDAKDGRVRNLANTVVHPFVPRYTSGAVCCAADPDEQVSAVLSEVSSVLSVDGKATIFGVLSAWPGYLQHAWREYSRLRSSPRWDGVVQRLSEACTGAPAMVPVNWSGFPADKLADLRRHVQPILSRACEHLLGSAVFRIGLAVPDFSLGMDQARPVRRVAPGGDHTARKRAGAPAPESASSG
ncbi:MAG: hypothetical protein ACUVRO_15485 [Armatimonadota bacterium]